MAHQPEIPMDMPGEWRSAPGVYPVFAAVATLVGAAALVMLLSLGAVMLAAR